MLRIELSLSHFNPDFKIAVASDSSDYDIGAVISHKFKDGKIKASRTLIAVEKFIVQKSNARYYFCTDRNSQNHTLFLFLIKVFRHKLPTGCNVGARFHHTVILRWSI